MPLCDKPGIENPFDQSTSFVVAVVVEFPDQMKLPRAELVEVAT
jgi:hypothetical protein